MPSLAEIISKNGPKFTGIENAKEMADRIVAVCKELGYNIFGNSESEPEYVPKGRFDELTAAKNDLKKQVGDLTTQIGELKKAAAGNEDLTKKIQALEDELKNSATKSKEVLARAAAKVAAIKAKAKDPDDVLKFVDFSKVVVNNDETITGLEEQIKTLSEGKKYLFEDEKPNSGPGGSNPQNTGNYTGEANPWKRESFNLTKQGEILKNDPATAAKFMAEAGVK